MSRILPHVGDDDSVPICIWQLAEGGIVGKNILINRNHVSTHIRLLYENENAGTIAAAEAFTDDILKMIETKEFKQNDSRSITALSICYSEAGLLTPLYFRGKMVSGGAMAKKIEEIKEDEQPEPFKSVLPGDFIGEVFSKVENVRTSMMLNMATKQGVTKFPDYYRYIETLPVFVCKFAIDDYSVARTDKERGTFMFIIRRAISMAKTVAKTIFQIFAMRMIQLPDAVLKLLMVELQFDKTLLPILWHVGRSDIIKSLYKDDLIDATTFVTAAKTLSAPDKNKLPVGYEKLIGNSTEEAKFSKNINYISCYTFLVTGKYRFTLIENPYLFLDAAEKGLVIDKPCITEYNKSLFELPDDIKKRIVPFVEENDFSNYLLRGIPVPDIYEEGRKIPEFILSAGLDPRNYPNNFPDTRVNTGWFDGCLVLTEQRFNEITKDFVRVDDHLSYSLDLHNTVIIKEHRKWGDRVYSRICYNPPRYYQGYFPGNILIALFKNKSFDDLVNCNHIESLLSLLVEYEKFINTNLLEYIDDFSTVLLRLLKAAYIKEKEYTDNSFAPPFYLKYLLEDLDIQQLKALVQ